MAQRLAQKVVNTFVKGLITEAGELTFPEDASVDELNCQLYRDGSRQRRLGLVYETGSQLSEFVVNPDNVFNVGSWINVGGVNGLEYLVVQSGHTLYFYNKSATPFSQQAIGASINLSTYEVSGSVGVANASCQFTSINGVLVVASEAMNTIYIERNNTTGSLTATQITFRIRDFEWQSNFTLFQNTSTTSNVTRYYDTLNAGWTSAALSTYGSPTLPPLTHPWFSGKDASENFSKAEWEKIYSGTSIIGNGHFILDFFTKNRSSVSGVSGLTTEIEASRFKAVATFSGRVFYAGLESSKNAGRILFSRIIQDVKEIGECFQVNDPASEFFSDLLDTDGGDILIPDAVNIQRLHVFGPSLFVFAENGVWQITGIDDVFNATAYAVNRISFAGLLAPGTFVVADGLPFWWSRNGIHTLAFDQVTGQGRDENISIGSIQTFWQNIPNENKLKVTGDYDRINRRIFWLYPSDGETVNAKKNEILILDVPLKAFYPWRIEDETTNTDYAMAITFYSGYGAGDVNVDVVDSSDDPVETSTAEQVYVVREYNITGADSNMVLLCRDYTTGKMTMALFNGETFKDWGTADYDTYAETGYEFFGDLMFQKTAPYLITYCRETEEGWTGNETIGYNPIRPSSLFVTTFWDFKKTTATPAQQVYRIKPMPVVNSSALSIWDSPATVVTTRTKIRGRGRSMRIRFEAEAGKDFILLGYGILSAANTNL